MNCNAPIVHRPPTVASFVRPSALGLLLTLAGCSQLVSPDAGRSIERQIEPESNREYLLYRPSRYDRANAWPLIVLCHSGFPDSPSKQLETWTTFAEEYGFLVIAPKLGATRGAMSRAGAREPQKLQADETSILSAVRHVRAGHNVSDDRVFLHGYSGGASAALFVGLRNREVFRAISLAQPRFDRGDMTDVTVYIDPHQPVHLNFRGSEVMTGKMGRECADWLRSYGADLRLELDPRGGYAQQAIDFFQDVVRKEVWMHVRTSPAESADPLALRFRLLCASPPGRYRWQFAEGDESPVAEPVHLFPKPGKYRVVVTAEWSKFGEHTRYLDVEVPSGVVRPAHGPP